MRYQVRTIKGWRCVYDTVKDQVVKTCLSQQEAEDLASFANDIVSVIVAEITGTHIY